MKALADLEKYLGDVFKNAPALPKGLKDFLVQVAPWLTLIGGLLSLWSAYTIYQWAGRTSDLVDYANELSRTFGGEEIDASRWSFSLYLAIAVLVVMGVLYLYAFSPLKARKKQGWDILFLALVINVVYGVVVAFSNYGRVSNLIGTIIGSAIGSYILFQVRDYYLGKAKTAPKAATSSKK